MKSLVVDDELVSRKKMQKIMSILGECEMAETGSEAIMTFKMAWEFGLPFDIITLDIDMPDMSGIEVLEKVREIERENNVARENQVKVLMVTSHTEEENVVGSIKAGCNNYIVKPFDKDKVFRKIENFGFEIV